ncbi:hypothetical protein P7K49_023520, partial [Saguinus oedipus]
MELRVMGALSKMSSEKMELQADDNQVPICLLWTARAKSSKRQQSSKSQQRESSSSQKSVCCFVEISSLEFGTLFTTQKDVLFKESLQNFNLNALLQKKWKERAWKLE